MFYYKKCAWASSRGHVSALNDEQHKTMIVLLEDYNKIKFFFPLTQCSRLCRLCDAATLQYLHIIDWWILFNSSIFCRSLSFSGQTLTHIWEVAFKIAAQRVRFYSFILKELLSVITGRDVLTHTHTHTGVLCCVCLCVYILLSQCLQTDWLRDNKALWPGVHPTLLTQLCLSLFSFHSSLPPPPLPLCPRSLPDILLFMHI